MKIKEIKKLRIVTYGTIIVETSVGDINFTYCRGEEDGNDWQVDGKEDLELYNKISDEESDNLYDLISNELNK